MSEKTFRSGSTSYYSIWKIPQCASFMKIAQPYNGRKITLQCQNLPRIFHASNSNKLMRRQLLELVHSGGLKRNIVSACLSRALGDLLSALKPLSLQATCARSAQRALNLQCPCRLSAQLKPLPGCSASKPTSLRTQFYESQKFLSSHQPTLRMCSYCYPIAQCIAFTTCSKQKAPSYLRTQREDSK